MASITRGRVWVTEEAEAKELASRGFGEENEGKLTLSPEETLFLKEKRPSFPVADGKKEYDFDGLMKVFTKLDKEFPRKYIVFHDLRNQGYVVKTGFKFGTHYRVYGRGVKPGEAHAIWLVHVVPEDFKCDFHTFSGKVRLAQNVRKKMVYAVVDKESSITYYKIERFSP
jgi:tRNA-intron endonuclease